MRLIDADEMIKRLQAWDTKDDMDTALFNFVLHRILEQPTAYNVDEVVARLEKKIQTHEHCIEYEKKNGTITEEFQQRKAVEVLNDAIEIVRGGGVWN